MKKLAIAIGALLPLSVFAQTYDLSHLEYTDALLMNRSTAVSVSVLSEINVLEGNPDGSFRPNGYLNRAEFVTIAMRLLDDDTVVNGNCFADVRARDWYADSVCRAKALGIIRGNAQEGVDPSQWIFDPSRPVNYAEVVKVLVELYAIPYEETGVWYEGYLVAAEEADIALGLAPNQFVTRGQMAELTAGFYAYARGELALLRSAQSGSQSSSSESSSSLSSSSSSSSSSTGATASSSSAASYDSLPSSEIHSQFILLGETSPVLNAYRVFSDAEPVDVRAIRVNVNVEVRAVEAFLIYDQEGRLLGRATIDPQVSGNRGYKATVPSGTLRLPKREDVLIYLRADLSEEDQGADSGDILEINNVVIDGTGEWSSSQYTVASSSSAVRSYQTARSTITSITNDDVQETTLISGTDRLIGSFRFAGDRSDSQAKLYVTDLDFEVAASNVSLSNVELREKNGGAFMTCTNTSTLITCTDISEAIGSFKNEPKTIQVYADVSFPADSTKKSLQIILNDPGSILNAGDIQWTDGSSDFHWVPFEPPVVRGTRHTLN